MKNISVIAFIKGGEQDRVTLPMNLVTELIENIKSKGSEFIHLSSGRSLEVTGLLFIGRDFNKDERVILTGTESEVKQ